MKRKKWLSILLLLLLVVVFFWIRGRQDTTSEHRVDGVVAYANDFGPSAVTSQLLVDFDNDVSDEQVRALEKKYRLKLRPNSRFSLGERLYRSVVNRVDLAKLINKLRREPVVERAEFDAVYGIPPLEAAMTRFTGDEKPGEKFPNDPKFKFQWHMNQINMPAAWPHATGKGVVVAVIDTGVTYTDRGKFKGVPDLKNTEIVQGYDFINRHEYGLDDHGHGTHVAGTIAQSTNNGVGVAGVAYNAKIMPLKVLSARGFGSVADIAEAIRFATDKGAKVINMSLGGSRSSKILGDAVKYAVKRGVTVVCAAGNDGRGRVSYPAAYPGALAVAATQFDRSTTFYSNWGKEIAVAAPGGNTRVDQNGDGMPDGVLQNTIRIGDPSESDYLLFMGTSMAAPHVAGVAALVIERGVTEPAAVRKLLRDSAKHPQNKESDHRYGAGIIDAAAAVSKASTTWGGYKLGFATLLGLLIFVRRKERGELGVRFSAGTISGLIFGSAGLFFLPALGVELPGALSTMATNGLPSWDLAILGADGHANALFFSVLIPLGLAALFYGVPKLRGLLFGLAVGVGAHLLFHLFFHSANVAWVPNILALDSVWLLANGLGCLLLANAIATQRKA